MLKVLKYAFKFMDILAKQLKEQFPYQLQSNSTAIPFSINSEFEPVISAEMKRINRLGPASALFHVFILIL